MVNRPCAAVGHAVVRLGQQDDLVDLPVPGGLQRDARADGI
jgi:hypothetical protein